MALIGLSFLLFIAGLEVDYERFRGRLLKLTGIGALSIAIGLVIGVGLHTVGLVRSPLLIAIMFSATGLGIVIAGSVPGMVNPLTDVETTLVLRQANARSGIRARA
jgi:Kef-type K+ transport system membrane component KefB